MRALLLATAALAAIPAVAGAQDATERRREQAYQNLNQLDQNQRIGEVQRQIDNIEIRRQSEAALRALQPPTRIVPPTIVVGGSSLQTGVPALQPLRYAGSSVLETPYVKPGSLAATEYAESRARLRARDSSALETPVATVAVAATSTGSTEDRLRDLELAASNARLRDLATVQRSN